MTTTLREQSLEFGFDDRWTVVRYDETLEHHRVRDQTGAKDVDFVARFRTTNRDPVLYLIEVKDFRGYRIQNRQRVREGELALEVAQKARDTVAGMAGAVRCSIDPTEWAPYCSLLHSAERRVMVVLWLEQDSPPPLGPLARRRRRVDVELSVLTKTLKRRSRWLAAKALVTSRAAGLPGVTVRNVPGAAGHGRGRQSF